MVAAPATVAPPSSPRGGGGVRVARLDLLRAIAVFLVMSRHLLPPPEGHPRLAALLEAVRQPGWAGVDLFFVLSGFLVSGLLFREKQLRGAVGAGTFLARRGFKIYPSYYAFLVGTFLWLPFRRVPTREDFAAFALFVQNYRSWLPGPWTHLWSLAVEEHFYFLLAAVLGWRLRAGRPMPSLRAVLALVGALAVGILVLRVAVLQTTVQDGATVVAGGLGYIQTQYRLDGMVFGVLLAYLCHVHPDRWAHLTAWARRWRPAALLALTPLALFPVSHPFTPTVGFTLYYLAFGVILAAALHAPAGGAPAAPRRAWERGLAWVGFYSYSVYLWHWAARDLAMWIGTRAAGGLAGWGLGTALFPVLAVAVGVLAARIIEVPFLALRDRLVPSRASAP